MIKEVISRNNLCDFSKFEARNSKYCAECLGTAVILNNIGFITFKKTRENTGARYKSLLERRLKIYDGKNKVL